MKRLISVIITLALIGNMMFFIKAENGETWEEWDDCGANISLNLKNRESGDYTPGDYFEFQSSTYCGETKGLEGTRILQIAAYSEAYNDGVQDVQFKDGDIWRDISEYNVSIQLNNDINRFFRVRFTENGIYTISSRFVSSDGSIDVACRTRYLTIKNGTYSISYLEPETDIEEESTKAPEPTTEEPVTEEPTTAEPITEEPTTVELTTEEPTTEEPTTVELTTAEATTNEPTTVVPTTEKPTTAEATTNEPTTVVPTTEKPTTVKPTVEEPTTAEPATGQTTKPEETTKEQSSAAATSSDSAFKPGADAGEVERAIFALKNDNDPNGTVYQLLQLKQSKVKKKSIKIKWKKYKGAKRYVVYGNRCGKTRRYKKIISTTKVKYVHKKLMKGTYYKFMVVALDANNKVICVSKLIHIATKGGKVGNHKAVKTNVRKSKLNLKVGRKFKVKAKAIPASGKLKVKKHRKIAYESSNPKIAMVSKKGVIKGVSKGKCNVYVYTQNGISKKIRVTVK